MEQAFNIVDLRKSMGMTQSEFALAIGLTTKSKVSEIEKHGRASVDVSLAIERLSILGGRTRIDAALLNEDVRKARSAPAECHGGDACASAGDGSDHATSFTPPPLPLSTGQAGEMSPDYAKASSGEPDLREEGIAA